ncbi:MAG: hypothetical protein WDN30_04420 [Pararobbsia sp.]
MILILIEGRCGGIEQANAGSEWLYVGEVGVEQERSGRLQRETWGMAFSGR